MCEVLRKGFVKVVAVQLGLSGPDADDAHFQLKNFITDVLVTRHWFSHGHRLSVTQVLRAMASLLGIISKEKYYIALGQSPEAIALMKTDPLTIGFKSL